MTLGEKIHLLRRRRGWSQKELGRLAEVNANYLARLERGEVSDPGSKLVTRLARILGVSLDYLLIDEREESELLPAGVALVGA